VVVERKLLNLAVAVVVDRVVVLAVVVRDPGLSYDLPYDLPYVALHRWWPYQWPYQWPYRWCLYRLSTELLYDLL
jgi:hypothetical protein